MVYTKFEAFKLDFQTAYPDVQAGAVFLGHMFYAHGLKQGAKSGLTIGLVAHLKDKLKQLGSVFNGSGEIFVDGRSEHSRWRIHFNDCFILGGVHSRGLFTLASVNEQETWWKEEFGDKMGEFKTGSGTQKIARQLDFVANPDAEFPLRVTQREIIALNIFGYTGTEADGAMKFECTDEAQADGATLVRYVKQVGDITKALQA